jgi:methyl-accepting chemotaxis protein
VTVLRRRRWMDVLRRAPAGGLGLQPARRASGALEDAALWSAQEQAKRSVEKSGALAERVASSVARQRGLIESSAERSGLMAVRAEGLGVSASRLSETFERLGVVALNAGLEGARIAEPQGRALLLVSEEIRVTVTRGTEALRKLTDLTEELAREAGEVQRQLERSRIEVSDVAQEAAQLRAVTQEADTALGELGRHLRRATGIDPEVARAVGVAAEHARGLVTALSALSTVDRGSPVLGALHPVIAPLARLLEDLGELGDKGAGGRRGGEDA